MRAGADVGHQALVERGSNDDGILGALADEAVALEDLRGAGGAHDHREDGRMHVLALLHGQLLHGAGDEQDEIFSLRFEVEGRRCLCLPQWLEQGSLVNVVGVGDEGQKGCAAIGIGDDELHCRPHGDVVEGRDAQVVDILAVGVHLDAQSCGADIQKSRSQFLQRESSMNCLCYRYRYRLVTHLSGNLSQIQLTQWLLQSLQTGHLVLQRQTAQAGDIEAIRRILGHIREQLLDLRLHAVANALHIVLGRLGQHLGRLARLLQEAAQRAPIVARGAGQLTTSIHDDGARAMRSPGIVEAVAAH